MRTEVLETEVLQRQCALRELEEETAIRIPRAYFAAVTNDDMTDVNAGKHYVTIVMIGCCSSEQEPKLMEPDKCEGWAWEQWDQLPGFLVLLCP